MLDIEEFKRFAKIDHDDDDRDIENEYIPLAVSYVEDGTGVKFNKDSPKHKTLVKIIARDFYDDRSLIQDKQVSDKVRYTVSSLMMQVKYGGYNV